MVMPPLTLAVLASVLQMHGADATITSDNKGIEDLLAPIRGQLQEGLSAGAPGIRVAAMATHNKGIYEKIYTRGTFSRQYEKLTRPTTPQGGIVAPNTGNKVYAKTSPVGPPTSQGGNVAPSSGGKGR
jgi:hypothetical protein